MFALARAIVYATLFIGFWLVFLPARLLSAVGVTRPASLGVAQVAGMVLAALGAGLAVSCILAFALVGRGTPAPFDPPRRLVVRGPYRYVRNPMYIGAGLVLSGVALFYGTAALWAYVAACFVAAHLFVVFVEEPTLRRTFGEEYLAYCRRVRRWWPGR